MDASQAYQMKDSVTFLDVREVSEWVHGHIDGSTHIPMNDLPNRLGEIDRSQHIVAVCRSGNRSDVVTRWLSAQGFDVENLDGGLKTWAKAGFPVVSSEGTPGKVA